MKMYGYCLAAVYFTALLIFGAPCLVRAQDGDQEDVPEDIPTDDTTDNAVDDASDIEDAADVDASGKGGETGAAEEQAESAEADGGGGGESMGFQRSGRMEFDERLVKGQAAKSGAVYLFQRAPRRLPGLVPFRRSYRQRIVEPVLGRRELKPPVYTTETPKEAEAEVAAREKETEEAIKEKEAEAEEQIKESKAKSKRGPAGPESENDAVEGEQGSDKTGKGKKKGRWKKPKKRGNGGGKK